MIDLHNLHIENRVALVANPLNEKRENEIEYSQDRRIEVIPVKEIFGVMNNCVDNLADEIESKLNVVEDYSLEDCYTKDGADMKCNFCPAVYLREGNLRNHLKSKHNRSFEIVCNNCCKPFADSTRLNRHKKLCK